MITLSLNGRQQGRTIVAKVYLLVVYMTEKVLCVSEKVSKSRGMGGVCLDMKVVFIGPATVGKTSLIGRYCTNTFRPELLSTIGVSFFSHPVIADDCDVTLMIWDTAGEERFRSVAPSLLRGSDGIVLVFDLMREESFDDLSIYYDMFVNTVTIPDDSDPPILLLGNKNDLLEGKDISQEFKQRIESWREERQIKLYSHVSAKTGFGVNDAMFRLAKLLVNRKGYGCDAIKNTANIVLQPVEVEEAPQSRRCC